MQFCHFPFPGQNLVPAWLNPTDGTVPAAATASSDTGPGYCGMARDFMASCSDEIDQSFENAKHLQFGKLITCLPKLLFSAVHFLGKLIQGGHDFTGNPFRYGTGGAIKMLANGADFGIELARSVIDTVILAAKELGAWQIGIGSDSQFITMKLDSEADKEEVRKHCIAAADSARLIEVTSWGPEGVQKPDLNNKPGLPGNWKKASIDDIPRSVMARRKNTQNSGGKLALRIEPDGDKDRGVTVLRSDPWSALRVAVFKDSETGEIALCFHGTDPVVRPGTLKSDINIMLGVRDSGSVDADILVKAFKAKYPGKGQLRVIGHSLGGNLAADAGENNDVPVVAFNALGLSLTQRIDHRKKIVGLASRFESAREIHINTKNDPLTAGAQKALPTKQAGITIQLNGTGGHGTSDITRDIQKTINDLDSAG